MGDSKFELRQGQKMEKRKKKPIKKWMTELNECPLQLIIQKEGKEKRN